MRKIAWGIVIALTLYVIIVGLATWLLPYCCPLLRRVNIIQVAIQFISAIATLSAVTWALFGSAVMSRCRKPCLSIVSNKVDDLCYIVKEESQVPDTEVAKLGIFAKVNNTSSVEAQSCQVVTSEIFASSDGIKFSSMRKLCTAAFKWVYEDGFETIVRKGVDKYIKVAEIIEKKTKPKTDPLGKIISPGSSMFSITVCIQNHINNKDSFEVGSDYKGVMLPLKVVSNAEDVIISYLKIVWLGKDLSDYDKVDKLKIIQVSEADAMKDII